MEVSPFNLNKNFVNEIRNDEENINIKIFREYFGYQNPSFYTPKQTKSRSRIPKVEISPFKLNENFVHEIRNDERNITSEMFREYFGYQNPSFSGKDLRNTNQIKK